MGSSRTRAWTCVPCIGRRILNHCATREAWMRLLISKYFDKCSSLRQYTYLKDYLKVGWIDPLTFTLASTFSLYKSEILWKLKHKGQVLWFSKYVCVCVCVRWGEGRGVPRKPLRVIGNLVTFLERKSWESCRNIYPVQSQRRHQGKVWWESSWKSWNVTQSLLPSFQLCLSSKLLCKYALGTLEEPTVGGEGGGRRMKELFTSSFITTSPQATELAWAGSARLMGEILNWKRLEFWFRQNRIISIPRTEFSFIWFILFYLLFWPHCVTCGILVPWPGMEPVSPAEEAWSLNHWTTREILSLVLIMNVRLFPSESDQKSMRSTWDIMGRVVWKGIQCSLGEGCGRKESWDMIVLHWVQFIQYSIACVFIGNNTKYTKEKRYIVSFT